MQKLTQSTTHARIAGVCLGTVVTVAALAPAVPWAQSAPASNSAPLQLARNTFVTAATSASAAGSAPVAVTGAPYSADSVTETTQTLADGNRIVHRQTSSIARDSQGRLRREIDAAPPPGSPAQAQADAPRWIEIDDTVAGVSYTLDEQRKTAVKHPVPMMMMDARMEPAALLSVAGDASMVSLRTVTMTVDAQEAGQAAAGQAAGTAAAGTAMVGPAVIGQAHSIEPFAPTSAPSFVAGTAMMAAGGHEKTESLGKQTIEGVETEGTRTTVTLPAGAIGNERAIDIVTERWFSPELQTAVLVTRHDPLVGVTTERLTNISRAEPPPSLFEVPADYKVIEPSFTRARLKNVKH